MLRPAGAALTSASARSPLPPPTAEDETDGRPRTPAWPFVTLAAVLVIMLGVGATLGVRHYLVPEPTENPTSAVNEATRAPDPPGEPTDVQLLIIDAGDGAESPGRVTVSWELPEGFSQEEHFSVKWKDLPENYQERYGVDHEVHGRNAYTLTIPPQLPEPCVEVTTINPNGGASEPVVECLAKG